MLSSSFASRLALGSLLLAAYASTAHAQTAGSPKPVPAPAPAAAPSASQPPAAKSGAQNQQAKQLHEQGVAHLTAGRYVDAVAAFDASYRAEATAPALYNLALAYQGMERPDKELEAFEAFVKLVDPKKHATHFAAARTAIDRIKSSYARFTLKLTPADATIDIDGTPVRPEKNELWVETGTHTIKVRAAGYETYTQRLDVAAGRFDLEVRLRQPTAPPDQRAATMVDEAMAQHAAGALMIALDMYREAYALFPTPRGTAQMGLAEEQLGDLGAAEIHLNEAVKQRKDPWIKQKQKDLKAALKRIQRQAGTLNISGSPDGTEILVNERSVGLLPLAAPVRVTTGMVKVRARKKGYTEVEQMVDVSARGSRQVLITLSEAPPATVVPMPFPAPEPVAAIPVAVVAPPVEAPRAPIESKQQEPGAVAQSDFESESAREALEGEPDDASKFAHGFEMALNFGYQPWLGTKPNGNSGVLAPQIVLGARYPWFLSYGLQLQGGFDMSTPGTEFMAVANPGFYVRGHIQRERKAMAFDVWGGLGFQPLAVQAALLKPEKLDLSMIDPAGLDFEGQMELTRLLATDMAGVDRVHTIQSINVPLELGATWFITPGFGLDLAMALTFWLPQQQCLHDEQDKLCFDSGLESQTSSSA
jgi:tetratricopeptide (TPR) repeat protein